jgi:hypothetical protein
MMQEAKRRLFDGKEVAADLEPVLRLLDRIPARSPLDKHNLLEVQSRLAEMIVVLSGTIPESFKHARGK